jgi:hypothetical protein
VILEKFSGGRTPSESHQVLARLPLTTYWTTNYDRLIEISLHEAGRVADVKYTTKQLARSLPRRDAVVYKMHGDVEHSDEAVLTKQDYEDYPHKRGPFVTALRGDLVSRTFLFLGFSFSDPNLDYVLSRIRGEFQEDGREHYALFRSVNRADFDTDAEFAYAQTKQLLVADDLGRYSIRAVFVDEYRDIPEILKRIEAAYKRKTLFVSGSAEEFGDWSQEETEEFLSELGRILVHHDYRIVSGFGLGVSNALLSGATEAVFEKREGRFEDYLTVRPFPRYTQNRDARKKLWTAFRRDIISKAGVALFLFGNKRVDDCIVLADGVHEEYAIADELGLDLVPVGPTGYVAAELAQKEGNDARLQGRPLSYRDSFLKLQEPVQRPKELLSRILHLLNQLAAR